jgi:hypothetical protein
MRRRPPDHHQMRTCTCDACWKVAHSYPGMTHRHCTSSAKGTWLDGEHQKPGTDSEVAA